MSAITWGRKINDASPLSLSWSFSLIPVCSLSWSLILPLSLWSHKFAPSTLIILGSSFLLFVASLSWKVIIPLSFSPFHDFSHFRSFYSFRQTSYAQKPWRIPWTQCGMKRWYITVSQQPTWPPKHSGRRSALNFSRFGLQLTPFPRRPNDYFAMQRTNIHAANSPVYRQQLSMLPSGHFQVIHYCTQTMPANCSMCRRRGNCSGVGCAVASPAPASPSAPHMEWLRSCVAILAQKVWRTCLILQVELDSGGVLFLFLVVSESTVYTLSVSLFRGFMVGFWVHCLSWQNTCTHTSPST